MEKIKNPVRGCGILQRTGFYIRADISKFGVLPPFVEFTKYIPYEGSRFRTWKRFNGIYTDLTKISNDAEEMREISAHLDRIADNQGNKTPVDKWPLSWCYDLIMWVGESFYPTPKDFITECKQLGLNKRIPDNQIPFIVSGKTRVYIIHPKAIDEKPGIIGYSYLTRVIYIKYKDIPQMIQNWEERSMIDIVELEE